MLNFFQIDRLFSRLGKTPTKLEYVLSKEAYEIYKLRYYIEKNVATRSLNKAKYYLNEYESLKQSKEPLHRQFIEMQKAQIAWMEEKDFNEIIDLCEQAIHRTIFDTDIPKNRSLLSSDELNLILFYWEISYEGGKGKATKEIKDVLNTDHILDTKIDIETGKITMLNFQKNKVETFKEVFPKAKVKSFYTDSYNDKPFMEISENVYLVKKGKCKKIK